MELYYDNIIFNLQKAGGISVYWYELIIRAINTSMHISFIEHKLSENIFRKALILNEKSIVRDEKLPIKLVRYLPLTTSLPKGAIFHSSYYRVCRQKGIKNVVTVHDFTYEYYIKGLKRYVHSLQKRYAIRHADAVICVSENTKKDLLRFYKDIDSNKVSVVYNGVSNEFKPLTNARPQLQEADRSYVLFVGGRSSYKQFDLVVDALGQYKKQCLVIVGGGALTKKEKAKLEDNLMGRYEHLEGINNKELNALYNKAFCLVYPSIYEGFGIPVIEAMQAGCPVIATRASSIPEVTGEAAVLMEEATKSSLIESLAILEKDEQREAYRLAGYKQAQKFSWDKAFEETLFVYKTLLNEER